MAADGLSVEMLPAGHGDALWVEWGRASDRHRMLIDGGPRRTFVELQRRFERLDPDDRRVDLLVVTHIDLDHIDGTITLLRDQSLGVTFSDIWFNAYRHLDPELPEGASRGAIQGEFVSAVLEDRELPWNRAFGNGAVVVPSTGSLPSVELAGGLRLVLVSPTPEKLLDLRATWDKTLEEAEKEPGDREEFLRLLESRNRGGGQDFGGDDSTANGSSIAFIAEYCDERWLLAGDAHEEVLLSGLQRYAADRGDDDPVKLDGFKLPHHGSVRNISADLLDAMECRRFLVSTNGAYFKHPDAAAIDLVIERARQPSLIFNYATPFTERWRAASKEFTSVYLDDVDGPTPDGESPAPGVHESAAATSGGTMAIESNDPDRGFGLPSTGETGETATTVYSDRPAGPPITVTVHHGSLDQADHPVLVGHYLATPLSGAEGFVDRRFDNRLSERLERNTYVGDVGTYAYITAPRRRLPADGVLVVGLGEYGDLTPLRLVEAVREALVRHALDEADRRGGNEQIELGVSSVLIAATGAHGLTIAASANAIVDAVREANRDLRGGARQTRAQYTSVQLFERNAPEAELAFMALQRPDTDPTEGTASSDLDGVIWPEELEMATGRLVNSLPNDSTEPPWWRIRVSERAERSENDPSHYLELEFSVGGRLARAGTVYHPVERRRIERMLRNAVGSKSVSSGLHTTLFELLFPNSLKWDLMAAQDVQLEVDDTTADIPWEMLAARNPREGTRGELALRSPLVRQLRADVSGAIARASKPTALVIGNPPVGRLAATLPGAYEEATAVAQVLDDAEYAVTARCYAPGTDATTDTTREIEAALFATDYRIVHVAAHGLLQPDDPTRTGVAIGPDDFLTSSVLGQLKAIPDLVFLNCCHVGAVETGIESGAIDFTQRNLNRLAASLARQLIRSGVRAVVVAGWAVDDTAATLFATTFYDELLGGETFGRAVHAARRRAMTCTPPSSTWGAYQCYGDAGYRLPSTDHKSHEASVPSTVRAVLRELESLVSWVETIPLGAQSSGHLDSARRELQSLEATVDERGWLAGDAGHLGEQFAEAWAAVGDFGQAIGWYEIALAAADGRMTLQGIEQLANLRDRQAAALIRKAEPTEADRSKAAELIAASKATIDQLVGISGTGERWALRAGHHKRRAVSEATETKRREAVRAAVDAYGRAYEDQPKSYTLLNYLQLSKILALLEGEESAEPARRTEFRAALRKARNDVRSKGDYWSAVALADGQLTKAIEQDRVGAGVRDLVELYLTAFECRSTVKQRRSTLDHLLDLADLHPDQSQKTALHELCAELTANV